LKTFHGKVSVQICSVRMPAFTKVLHQQHFCMQDPAGLYRARMPRNTSRHHLIPNRICRLLNLQYKSQPSDRNYWLGGGRCSSENRFGMVHPWPREADRRRRFAFLPASKVVLRRGCGNKLTPYLPPKRP
jgi:hypothetical protein